MSKCADHLYMLTLYKAYVSCIQLVMLYTITYVVLFSYRFLLHEILVHKFWTLFFSLFFPVIIHFRFSVWNTCKGYEVWLLFTQLWVFFANKSECIPLDAFFICLHTHTTYILWTKNLRRHSFFKSYRTQCIYCIKNPVYSYLLNILVEKTWGIFS